MSVDPATLAFYEAEAASYAETKHGDMTRPRFDAFLAALPEGARVLDLGCGSGWAAAALNAAGHRADAMDASPAMAAEARRLYGLEVAVRPFHALSARARYDAVWAWFSLHHAPRASRGQIFERLHTALKPGGLLAIGARKGPMDRRDDFGRLVAAFSEDDLTRCLTAAGFSDIALGAETGRAWGGQPALNIFAEARA